MKSKNTRIARLKEVIALEEKRAALQSHIATINQRLSTIQNELYGAAARRAAAKEERKVSQKLPKRGRKGRGELAGDILEVLQTAGRAGASVKELAERIGVKTANIHSWFSANVKKITALKKVGEARYALLGNVETASKVATKAKGKQKTAAKAAKPSKPTKPAKAVKTRKGKVARGALKDQILKELTQAGADGISIKDLAEKLNANYKNLYVWFVTTGKRISGIKKVGPAQYKLEAAA
ncbi:MAG: hypothetical protein ACFUZC_14065 [Chthoniobacteraceae bacterium]